MRWRNAIDREKEESKNICYYIGNEHRTSSIRRIVYTVYISDWIMIQLYLVWFNLDISKMLHDREKFARLIYRPLLFFGNNTFFIHKMTSLYSPIFDCCLPKLVCEATKSAHIYQHPTCTYTYTYIINNAVP